jgi:type 1 glutamine amidotransferase
MTTVGWAARHANPPLAELEQFSSQRRVRYPSGVASRRRVDRARRCLEVRVGGYVCATRSRRRVLAGLAALPLVAVGWPGAGSVACAQAAPARRPARVLVVTATAGFYHDSIPTARRVLEEVAERSGDLEVVMALGDVRSLNLLNAATLAEVDVVCFANTSGELPLDHEQKSALLDFVAGGRGFVGTHSATDTFYEWPAYGELVGASFRAHPWIEPVTVVVEDAEHPMTRGLGPSFEIAEEIYVFRANPRPSVHTLLRLDRERAGPPADLPDEGDYPLAWCKAYGAGRVCYNALGHFAATWEDPRFQSQLLGALRWAAGLEGGGCG